MSSYRYTFSKEERLCSQTIIQDLFARKGTQQAHRYPLLVFWRFQELPTTYPAQVLISIPSKKFRKAHDRHRLRRQLREAYRLHKQDLYDFLKTQRLQCAVVIVYIAQEKLPYKSLEDAFRNVIPKIIQSAS